MMRFPEVYACEMTCVKPNALAKDLELVMACTTNGYSKQCVMRFPEVYLGEMTCVKPNAFAKDLDVNTSGKAGAQIPQLPLGDISTPWGR
jgi:hypothetical protein